MPSNVTEINEGAFSCCYNLKNVTISEGVKVIGEYAFLCEKGTSSLEKVFIPKSVENISEFAFEDCDKLVINGENASVAKDYAEYKGIRFEVLKTDNEDTDKSTVDKDATQNDKPAVSQNIKLKKVTNLKQKASYSTNSISVKWDALTGTTGYEVYRAGRKNGKYVRVATAKGSSFKNNKLKAGKTYYYKVRAYKLVNDKKVYGS